MENHHTIPELIEAFEEYTQQLETDKEYCLNVYSKMRQHIDQCITQKTYYSLFELLPYFEEPDDYPQFHPSSETRVIFVLLNILKMEFKYNTQFFLSTVNSYAEFKQQYTLTVFAFRRLELALSDIYMAEACSYLKTLPLSVYAAKIIIENEYFENHKLLYKNLYRCMQDIWSLQDRIYWLLSLSEYDSSEDTLLELASACLENNDYSGAYQILLKIRKPSAEAASIITSLGEALHNE